MTLFLTYFYFLLFSVKVTIFLNRASEENLFFRKKIALFCSMA